MHVATDIRASMFEVASEGRAAPIASAFPDWTPTDRLGVVIREPFGSLGASLLLQVAALLHSEVRPSRRDVAPQYPQLYAFHVGGRFGDHSSFDVWPPRREVFLGDDPAELLAAVNDRAITRLLMTDEPSHSTAFIDTMASGWTDRWAAVERLRSVWAYGTDGHVDDADLVVSSAADELERMAEWALTPEETFARYRDHSGEQLVAEMQIGPSTPSDLLIWRDALRARTGETSPEHRREMLQARRLRGPVTTQHFRSLSSAEALARC